jgi:hypothetical protein
MLEYSFLIDTVTKKFEFDYSKTNPVIPLIGSLSKAPFCNVSGYPVSKAIWTGFSDSDMIDRFGRICRNLSHYYSGSSNKQSLYQIKYILRLSCARNSNKLVSIKLQYALFCKDWVQGFSKNSLRKKTKCFLNQILPKTSFPSHEFYRERIWYLDILRINDLVNHS